MSGAVTTRGGGDIARAFFLTAQAPREWQQQMQSTRLCVCVCVCVYVSVCICVSDSVSVCLCRTCMCRCKHAWPYASLCMPPRWLRCDLSCEITHAAMTHAADPWAARGRSGYLRQRGCSSGASVWMCPGISSRARVWPSSRAERVAVQRRWLCLECVQSRQSLRSGATGRRANQWVRSDAAAAVVYVLPF